MFDSLLESTGFARSRTRKWGFDAARHAMRCVRGAGRAHVLSGGERLPELEGGHWASICGGEVTLLHELHEQLVHVSPHGIAPCPTCS